MSQYEKMALIKGRKERNGNKEQRECLESTGSRQLKRITKKSKIREEGAGGDAGREQKRE